MKDKIVYLVPHEDDEMLIYGVSIMSHLWEGYDVHVVLLTDGSADGSIETVNSKLSTPISRKKFSEARRREFKQSTTNLGVEESNIHIYNYTDGKLQVDDVKQVARDFLNRFPDTKFRVLSYLDEHPDHAATGEALQQMYESGEVRDVRFYLKELQFKDEHGPDIAFMKMLNF